MWVFFYVAVDNLNSVPSWSASLEYSKEQGKKKKEQGKLGH